MRAYVYDVKTSSFVLKLGDGYGGKTITSPIDIDDWEGTVERLQKDLILEGINENYIRMICNTADNNAIRISDDLKGRLKAEKQETNEKQKHMAFTYSDEGKDDLHEAAIAGGKLVFLKYDSKTNKLVATARQKETRSIVVKCLRFRLVLTPLMLVIKRSK